MTTEANGRKATSACDGVTKDFGVPFQFIANADLQVYLLDAADDANEDGTLLVQGDDYTISGVGRAKTASITTTVAYAAGKFIRRFRVTPLGQDADYVPNDGFPADSHELQLDKLALRDEEHEDDLDAEAATRAEADRRSLRVPEQVPAIAAVAERKGKFLKFNEVTGYPEPAEIVGTQGDPGPQGEQGPQGPQGEEGPIGPMPELEFSADTGLAGSDVVVDVTPTVTGYQVNLTIPRGAPGASGALGDADYGDITVTGGGTAMTIKNGAVTLAKMANLADAGLLGGTAAGAVGLVSFATIKTQLALNDVNNTSDANKPVSTAQQAALDLKANIESPEFTGNPKAPTPTAEDADASIATTGFVDRLRDIGVNEQGVAYELQLSDRGKTISTIADVTVPANTAAAFPLGAFVEIYNASDDPIDVTFTSGTDVFRKHGALATVTTLALAGRSLGQLRKTDSLTEWLAVGFS